METVKRNQPRKPREKTNEIPGEVWKLIENYGGFYYCSSLGRFRKLFRDGAGTTHDFIITVRPLNGSMSIVLTKAPGYSVRGQAGVLLLDTFKPEEDSTGKYLYYKDGDFKNLNIDNLFWASKKEIKDIKNSTGQARTKLVPKFYKTAFGVVKSKLVLFSENEKAEMKKMYADGFTQVEIAEHFGGTQAYVSKIIRDLA